FSISPSRLTPCHLLQQGGQVGTELMKSPVTADAAPPPLARGTEGGSLAKGRLWIFRYNRAYYHRNRVQICDGQIATVALLPRNDRADSLLGNSTAHINKKLLLFRKDRESRSIFTA
ncbi:MAG: hypothetical protein CW335_02620, partial [Clostridiales bacterium]|nr:hypothetical protein [Clostridiales bacterium]